MEHITLAEANRDLPAIIARAQREPLLLQDGQNNEAILLSPHEYKEYLRMRSVRELDRICHSVSERAAAMGMTSELLEEILAEDNK